MKQHDAEIPEFKSRFAHRIFKIMALTALLSGLLTGFLSFYISYRSAATMRLNKGKEHLKYLANNAETPIVSRDNTFLEPVFSRLLQINVILGAAVYDLDGNLLFSKVGGGNDDLISSQLKLQRELERDSRVYTMQSGDVLTLVYLVTGAKYDSEKITFGSTSSLTPKTIRLGYAVLKLSTRLTGEEKKNISGRAVAVGLTVLILGILFALGAASKIIRPVREIIKGVDLLRNGKLQSRIKVKTDDEMGKIADSFNRLARNLSRRMSQLENWKEVLQEKVDKSTEKIKLSREISNLLISPLSLEEVKWKTIGLKIMKGSEARGCIIFSRRDNKFETLFNLSAANKPVKLNPAKFKGKKFVKLLDGSKIGLDFTEAKVSFQQLSLLDNQSQGQLVLIYKKNDEIPLDFLEQIIYALSSALGNIDSYRRMDQLTNTLEQRNKTLKKQKLQVEEASRLKSEFFANVSHELKTPINAIIGYSEMLANEYYGKVNEEQIMSLKAIESSGRNLFNLINTILDHSKIESGKMPLYIKEFSDIRKQIKDTVDRNQSLTKEKPYDVKLELPEFPVPCQTDNGKLQQILTNLLSNAIKFTAEGQVKTILKTQGKYFLLIIEDTGIGIREENFEKIFEEFKQIDGSSTRSAGGTGLGLSVSQQFARLLGGRIEVESEYGKGSRFTLKILRNIKKSENEQEETR
ncbi:MAG: ATP-binding protein [Deltaproteobacteria bacterium]|jgi:signal transduction histidine kinase/HAMP domain-containing protein|nr:ATP-binding protein [Deltaproteobacteria bacterium]